MYRKIVGIVIATFSLVSFSITAFAGNIEYNEITQINASIDQSTVPTDIEAVLDLINSDKTVWSRESLEIDNEFVSLWENLKASGEVYVDCDGHINLRNMDDQSYNDLLSTLSTWNNAIDIGILSVDPHTMNLSSPEVTYSTLENVSKYFTNTYDEAVPLSSPHGCGYNVWNLRSLCSQNYNIIKNFYNDMLKASMVNPGIDPWASTVGYWVGLVMERGAWDYKSNPNYMGKYFCLIYGDTTYEDHYVEWVGNYNYGYTGKFLFGLNMLHVGSSAVAGFDPKDKETDWPAIDEGYYDAP